MNRPDMRVKQYGRRCLLTAAVLTIAAMMTSCSSQSRQEQAGPPGEALFLRFCSGCHPDGKNLIYPSKDLRRLTLAANGISRPEQIVAVIRNPGRGMPRFDRTVLPDDQATRIAEYVLSAFK